MFSRLGVAEKELQWGVCAERQSSGNLSYLSRSHGGFPHLPPLLTCLFQEADSSGGKGKRLIFTRLQCQTVLFSLWSPPPISPPPGNPYPCLPNDTSNTVKNDVVMNPFVSWVPFPVFIPSLPLFECIFSAMTILYFVPMHTYLSCHCKHQWQSPYSFMYFSFTILFTFHTSLCLKAWGFNYHFFFHSTSFILCRLYNFLSQYFLCSSLHVFCSGYWLSTPILRFF